MDERKTKLRCDEEFKALIPPLTDEEYKTLEQSILKEGCREPILIWDITIIDGHNRYAICQKHNLSFDTKCIQFKNNKDAKIWIIDNQRGRRNLTVQQKLDIGFKRSRLLKPKAVENMKVRKGNQTGATIQISEKLEPVNLTAEAAKYAGVSTDTASKYKKIQESNNDELKEKVAAGELSINQGYKYIRYSEKINQQKKIPKNKTQLETSKQYKVLYADPPWDYTINKAGDGDARDHYSTMSLEELCDLPVKKLAEEDAVLFLWTTSPFAEKAFSVIEAWGFTYKAMFVWDKVKHNMGHYNSVRHELLYICTKGSCTPEIKKLYDSVQSIERTKKHSEKPEEFRQIIDTLYPSGSKIELFARKKVDGWDTWGNEVAS